MNPPTLYAADPLVIPAQSLDKIWVEVIEIFAPSPSEDATAIVRLRRFGTDGGVTHVAPDTYKIEIEDLLQKAADDPDLAAAVQAIMKYVAKAGRERGLIAPPEA